MRNDTPLVTVEQHFTLRLTPSDAGALLGALDRSLLSGTPVARIYDALAEAARCHSQTPRITPVIPPRDPSVPPPGGVGDERIMRSSMEQNIPVFGDSLMPRASAGQFIDDPLS